MKGRAAQRKERELLMKAYLLLETETGVHANSELFTAHECICSHQFV